MDREDELAEQLDRLLDGDQEADSAQPLDPRLRLAAHLRSSLPREQPLPDFRARLKADLLERYADNVRQFPAPTQEAANGERRPVAWAASALAVAAAVALVIGLRTTHQDRQQPRGREVARAIITRTATAAPSPSASGTVVSPGGPSMTGNPAPPPTRAGSRPYGSEPARGHGAPSSTPIAGGQLADNVPSPHGASPSPSATAVPTGRPSAPSATAAPRPTSQVAQVLPFTPEPSATQPRPSATPVPPTATPRPSATARLSATATLPSAPPSIPPPTRVSPSATATRGATAVIIATQASPTPISTASPAVSATATPWSPSATSTVPVPQPTPTSGQQIAYHPVQPAPATPSATAAPSIPSPTPTTAPFVPSPSSTATGLTPMPSATPPPATSTLAQDTPVSPLATAIIATPSATQAPAQLAENVPSSTPPVFNAAGSLARATPTATVTGPFFPLPLPANAGAGSPLAQTQPLTADIALHFAGAVSAAAPPLAVLTPVPHQIAVRELLQSYGFTPLRPITNSDSLTSFSAQVNLAGHRYRASMTATTYGYHLLLQQAAPISSSVTPTGAFDAVAAATTFLHQHQLDATLAEDAANAGPGGSIVHFATRIPYEVYSGGATLVYSVEGILQSADIRLVDASAAFTIPAISEQAALAATGGGEGLVQVSDGSPLGGLSTVTGTALIYVPVGQQGALVFEPVYRFVGTNTDGSPFAIYVPALDRAYLKP